MKWFFCLGGVGRGGLFMGGEWDKYVTMIMILILILIIIIIIFQLFS